MRGAPLRFCGFTGAPRGGSGGARAPAARDSRCGVTPGLSRLWRAPFERQIFSGARQRLRSWCCASLVASLGKMRDYRPERAQLRSGPRCGYCTGFQTQKFDQKRHNSPRGFGSKGEQLHDAARARQRQRARRQTPVAAASTESAARRRRERTGDLVRQSRAPDAREHHHQHNHGAPPPARLVPRRRSGAAAAAEKQEIKELREPRRGRQLLGGGAPGRGALRRHQEVKSRGGAVLL